MHFFSFLSKSFLHESISFDSFEVTHFIHIFLYFPFCINILVIKLKNKNMKGIKNLESLNKNLYYVLKDAIVFKPNINHLKNLVSSVSLIKYNKTKNFSIRINNNFVYIISVFKEEFIILIPHYYSILSGIETFGQGKILVLLNNLIYSRGYNSIIVSIFITFPCFFLKIIQIFRGINFIIDLKANFILLVVKTKIKKLRFFIISCLKFYKTVVISQIGNFKANQNNLNLLDISVLKNEILIANSENNTIRTWKIKFDLNLKIKIFEPCAFLSSHNNSVLTFLFWGGTFYNYLLTGELNHRIMVWNELLIPLLKINNLGCFLLDCKFLKNISGFIVLFKKNYSKIQYKKNSRYNKSLHQTSIKLYSNWNISKLTFQFILDRFYYLGIIKKVSKNLHTEHILKNFEKIYKDSSFNLLLLNFILNILEKIKSKKIDLSSLYFIHNLLEKKFWNLFFFRKNFIFLIIKQNLLYEIWKIGQFRKISLREIEIEEIFCNKKKKTFFYLTCKICKRISKIKYNSKKINCCEFLHYFTKSLFFFPLQHKRSNLIYYKIQITRDNTMLIDENSKKSIYRNIKYVSTQKEFIWF